MAVLDVAAHDLRHAAHDGILAHQIMELFVDRLWYGLALDKISAKPLDLLRLIALRPQEFLERQRMHRYLTLKADRHRLRLFILALPLVLDAKKRTGRHDIVPSVQRNKLECRPRIPTFLYLIEEYQCSSRDEADIRPYRGNTGTDGIRIQGAIKHGGELRFLDEVDLNETRVVLASELFDDERLANLPRPLDKKTLPLLVSFPTNKEIVDLSF